MTQVRVDARVPTDEPATAAQREKSRLRAILAHALRLILVIAILDLIHYRHVQHERARLAAGAPAPAVELVAELLPGTASVGALDPGRGVRNVRSATGKWLGALVETSPEGDEALGFSGPTNLLFALDDDDRIVGARILWSRDTRDHVALIREQPAFLATWDGLRIDEATRASVDAVSGATLTSHAIADAVALRFGGERRSSRFPEAVAPRELQGEWPRAAAVEPDPARPGIIRAIDAQGEVLGAALRTSPAADSVIGYQGPTDALVFVDADGYTTGTALRRSFDNEPYVGYVREDAWFEKRLAGLTLEELAMRPPGNGGVDGVSGATMTSLAVIDGARAAAQAALAGPTPGRAGFELRARDLATALVVLFGLLVSYTGLRHRRVLRALTLLAAIVVLGVINGDLVSLAVLVGWARSGVPWELATGLVLLTAVALLAPATTKRNTYCDRLCPHGALQQLIRARGRRVILPRGLARALSCVPPLLLGWVLVVALFHLPLSPVDVEPFDAWVVRAAGPASIAIAIIGLGASFFVPMAYCRYGCPTGSLLDFLRFHRRRAEDSRADLVAFTFLVVALLATL